MQDERDALDSELAAGFAAHAPPLPAEPFTSLLEARIGRMRRRRRLAHWGLRVALAGVVAAASPWLVDASIQLSAAVDVLSTAVDGRLETPFGLAVAVLGLAAAAALRILLGRGKL